MNAFAAAASSARSINDTNAGWIEAAAWEDIVTGAPVWLRTVSRLKVERHGEALLLASPRSQSLLFNRTIGLGWGYPARDAVIGAVMNRYWELGVTGYLVHADPDAQPERLGEMLERQGLCSYRRSWVKLQRAATHVQPGNDGIRVRVAKAADLALVASVAGIGFDLTQYEAEVLASVIGRRRWTVLIAEYEGHLAGTAAMYSDDCDAYCAFAATRPEFRGIGVHRALLTARINLAAAAGCESVIAETGFPRAADEPNPAYHNFLQLGFRAISLRENYALPSDPLPGERST